MRTFVRLACLIAFFLIPFHGARADTPKTVTSSQCFQDSQGNCDANGTLVLQLSRPAQVASGGGQVAPNTVRIQLDSNGLIPSGTVVWANDQLNPTGTGYAVTISDVNGLIVSRPGYWALAGGAPIDLAQEQPVNPYLSFP